MVKLLSFLALSALIITPTFAAALRDLETRDDLLVRELDEVEAAVFARDMQSLFARQYDSEPVDLVRRHPNKVGNFVKKAFKFFIRSEPDSPAPQSKQDRAHMLHAPLTKHELREKPPSDLDAREFDDEILERNLDYELYVRGLIDADLAERFYDDLD